MTNRKLSIALFATAGVLGAGAAYADVGSPTVLKVFGSSKADVANRVTSGNPTASPPVASRLRHNQNNEPGHEQPAIAMFVGPNGDGKTGIYVDRASNLYVPGSGVAALLPSDGGNGNGGDQRPAQGAMAMFQLTSDSTGTVSAQLLSSYKPTFITSHASQDYRAFNQPDAYVINGGSAIAVEYNWRQQGGGNRTKRWLQVFDITGKQILTDKNGNYGEQEIYAKTNDDCSMNMDGHAGVVADFDVATKFNPNAPATSWTSHVVEWEGCNGNGEDKGWMVVRDITCNDAKNPTACTTKTQFDIALDQEEERSRGYCSVDINNRNTAVCSWTAGNDQPQTKGVWLAAADITPGTTGTNRQDKVLWSTMIDGRKQATSAVPYKTYAERAMHERVMVYNPTSGALEPSSYIIWRSGDAHGNNNNNQKGGLYLRDNIGVFQIDPTTNKLVTVQPLTDMSVNGTGALTGLDGTHLGVSSVVFGTTDSLATQKPGLMLMVGSHTGGNSQQINFLALDQAPNAAAGISPSTITAAGTGNFGTASFDRAYYSNYLGENPGNQGRNFSASLHVVNPYCADGSMGSCDKLLMLIATTGKDPSEIPSAQTTYDQCYASDDTAKASPYKCAQLKLSSYLTVIPVAQHKTVTSGGGSGSGSGSGTGSGTGSGSGSNVAMGQDPGATLGGCSTGAGTGGAISFLLIGFAAFIRRRR